MQIPPIFCLHGFLGLTSDWDCFSGFSAIDLYQQILPFESWELDIQKKGILLGYSLGGRLALHSLIQSPEKWLGGVIISAHPGLPESLRKDRYQKDLEWANRFEGEESWELLLNDWNQQAVFVNSKPVQRTEKDFDRRALARAMRIWSLGLQRDLTEEIYKLPLPLLWIAGEKDEKFSKLALSSSHPKSKIWIAKGVGHRVPWECPKQFYQQVTKFCEEVR